MDYDFETEALADFKFAIDPAKSNSQAEEDLIARMTKEACGQSRHGGLLPSLTCGEAMKFIQPYAFVKGKNIYA